MTVLTGETLAWLNADVFLPRYDRRHVTTGIVHIGVGNFHRSHQAMYIDALMNSGAAMDWGICGIGLQPSNRRMPFRTADLTAIGGLGAKARHRPAPR